MKMEFKSFRTKEELMAYIQDEVTSEYAPFGLVMHEMGEADEESMGDEALAVPPVEGSPMGAAAEVEEYYPPEEIYT